MEAGTGVQIKGEEWVSSPSLGRNRRWGRGCFRARGRETEARERGWDVEGRNDPGRWRDRRRRRKEWGWKGELEKKKGSKETGEGRENN